MKNPYLKKMVKTKIENNERERQKLKRIEPLPKEMIEILQEIQRREEVS